MTSTKSKEGKNVESFELQTYGSFLKRSKEGSGKGYVPSNRKIGTTNNSEKSLYSKQKELNWLDLQTKEALIYPDETCKCHFKRSKFLKINDKISEEGNESFTIKSQQIESLDLHVYETMTLRNTYQNDHVVCGFENPGYLGMSNCPNSVEHLSNQTYEYVEKTERKFLYFQNKGYRDKNLTNLRKELSESISTQKLQGVASLDNNSLYENTIFQQRSYNDNLLPEEVPATHLTDISCTSIDFQRLNIKKSSHMEDTEYEELNYADTSTTSNIYASVVENNDVLSERTKNMNQNLLKDESLTFLQKLRYAKAACSFNDYIILVIYLVYKEVSGYMFLDLYNMAIGLISQISGAVDFYDCPLSKCLPLLLIIFGTLAFSTSSVKLTLRSRKFQKKCCSCLSTLSIILRVFMALSSIAGFCVVVMDFPPNEDLENSSYCSPIIYWFSMYVFALNILLIFIIILHGVTLIAWYCL